MTGPTLLGLLVPGSVVLAEDGHQYRVLRNHGVTKAKVYLEFKRLPDGNVYTANLPDTDRLNVISEPKAPSGFNRTIRNALPTMKEEVPMSNTATATKPAKKAPSKRAATAAKKAAPKAAKKPAAKVAKKASGYTGAPGSAVREFARANGHDVGTRGRFSAELVDAFNKGKTAAKRYTPPSAR